MVDGRIGLQTRCSVQLSRPSHYVVRSNEIV